ncbi:MAG: hypothetical protein KC503_31245 [Myxococcales bacterium]|nr:hypothetical protein [Myxococcales bacterium]
MEPSPSRPLKTASSVVLAACGVGLLCAALMFALDLDRTDRGELNIFYYLYTHYEPALLIFSAVVLALLWYATSRGQSLGGLQRIERAVTAWPARRSVLCVAAAVLALCWVGTFVVYHNFPFSQDEYTVVFQSKILAHGELEAKLPAAWQGFGHAARPVFVTYDAAAHTYRSAYLPVYAAMRAALLLVGVPTLLNPLLAALTVLLLASTIKKLWPQATLQPLVGALLLATSSQFLVVAMSDYTMTAHLMLNLLWLRLHVGGSRWGRLALPWVGTVAMGLHAFVPHALFVAPFLLRYPRERRWAWTIYLALVYLGASVLWMWATRVVNPTIGPAAAAAFGLPGARQVLDFFATLPMLASWGSVATGVLALLALGRFRELPTPLKDAAYSAALTLAFYLFFLNNQGHGWGHRYFHPVLGNLVLLAIPGWQRLKSCVERERATSFLAVSLIMAVAITLPARCYQVEAVVGPFARTAEYIAAQKATVVMINPASVWYGQDVVRNDPYLGNKPKMLFPHRLTRRGFYELRRRGTVRLISQAELVKLGMFPTRRRR